MNDEDIIKNLYIELCEASMKMDVNKLNDILAENYVLTHMTGKEQSKKEYIDSVINGDLKYFESIHEDIKIEINGDIAKVVGKTKTLASPFGMSKSWWKLKQDMVVKKINNEWKIISSIASTYWWSIYENRSWELY